jgi:hypothetical protein
MSNQIKGTVGFVSNQSNKQRTRHYKNMDEEVVSSYNQRGVKSSPLLLIQMEEWKWRMDEL